MSHAAMLRRTFVKSTAATLATASLLRAATPAPRWRKGFMYSTLRGDTAQKLSVLAKFALLREAGFDGVEVMSAMNQDEVRAASRATGLAIPSVVISTHWAQPLTDANPAIRQKGLDGLLQGLRDAKAYGASSVLLVPGAVTKDVSYAQAYERSITEIKKALPLAESLGVIIAIENVWNRFLLSPLEAAAYVDSFQSPFVKWHFDVGNVVDTSWPEHWIRTLGPRIVQVHVKEYSRQLRDTRGPRAGFEVELGAGDSDWPAVRRALDDVGYRGWMIAEQWRPTGLSDADWLGGLSRQMDAALAG